MAYTEWTTGCSPSGASTIVALIGVGGNEALGSSDEPASLRQFEPPHFGSLAVL
jgi:hypothetical protein